MEHHASFISLDHLVDIATYAKLCKIDSRGAERRVREKRVVYAVVDGLKLIDIVASPPAKQLPRGFKPSSPRVDSKGIALGELVNIVKLCRHKGITTSRFYKAILFGRLRAVYMANRFFVYKTDPAFQQVLKED
ncbi:MAG: hypothetical protein AB7G44_07685 [Bacteroidia bacterium]